jgi:dipeptidyl aminopeptidase/acylaminoacyl peptidase
MKPIHCQLVLLLLAVLALAGCASGAALPGVLPAGTTPLPATPTQPPLLPVAIASPASSRILFTSARDRAEEICVMNADGSGLLRLTEGAGPDTAPAWAPDGQHVAFVANVKGVEQLFLMRPDGTERRQLTSLPAGARWPTWSPDGARVAFTTGANDAGAIISLELAVGAMTTIADGLIALGAWPGHLTGAASPSPPAPQHEHVGYLPAHARPPAASGQSDQQLVRR